MTFHLCLSDSKSPQVTRILLSIQANLNRCAWYNGYPRKILDSADCIPHNTNTLEKSINPIILPPAMSK